MRLSLVLLILPLGACAEPWRGDFDHLRADLAPIVIQHNSVPPGPSTDADLDQSLSDTLDLDTVLRIALLRNAQIREAAARASAMIEEVGFAGALNDPVVRLGTEEVPLSTPSAFNEARMNTLGLEQTFPFPGTLGFKSEAALRRAESMFQMYRDREREITARVKKAYIEYAAMARTLEIHKEHVSILEEFEKISSTKFRTGAVSQQDVLKPQVELVMLQNMIIGDEQKVEMAKADLNQLLNRPADAALGTPREVPMPEVTFDVQELQRTAASSHPMILAADRRVKAAAAALEAAEREASTPEFMLGVEYQEMSTDDAWAGMLGVNLPWLTGKHSAEVRKMREELRAEQIAVEDVRSRIQFEVRGAWLRVEAARKSVALFKGELLPKSRQNVDVSRASYEKEKASFLDLLDAERSQRDVKIGYTTALAALASAVADLERAVGSEIVRKP